MVYGAFRDKDWGHPPSKPPIPAEVLAEEPRMDDKELHELSAVTLRPDGEKGLSFVPIITILYISQEKKKKGFEGKF